MNDLKQLLSKMQDIVDFYELNEGRIDTDIKEDIIELGDSFLAEAENLEYVHEKVETIKTWEYAI